jgi:hypothetical protein
MVVLGDLHYFCLNFHTKEHEKFIFSVFIDGFKGVIQE